MFHLCSVESTDLSTIFGVQERPGQEAIPPKYDNLQIIMLGQRPDCTGYLLFSNMIIEEFTKHNSVPEGYDFIFRQSWGLRITEEVLHRVISTLRAESYPPMADYLDAIVKNDQQQLDEYLQACLAVKEKYPKFTWS